MKVSFKPVVLAGLLIQSAFAPIVHGAPGGNGNGGGGGGGLITDVVIANLNDFISSWPGLGDLVITDSVCVGRDPKNTGQANNPRGYNVTPSSAAGFTLTNGTSTIPYSVEFVDTAGAISGTGLSNNVASSGYTTQDGTADCAAGLTTATIIIRITEADLMAAQSGPFNGSISFTINPE